MKRITYKYKAKSIRLSSKIVKIVQFGVKKSLPEIYQTGNQVFI